MVSLIGSRSRSFSFSSFEWSSRLLSSSGARSILRRTAGLCRNEVAHRYPRFREHREESFAVMTSFFLSYK